jgi:isopentenyl-diphosphate Delta-isomerase
MEEERVDIVNSQDEIVGQSSKPEAHKKGLLHRTVIAEVIGSDGKWTLIKQAADRQDAGKFVSPIGGHVRAGETEDTALKREASEEYGLPDDIYFHLIGKAVLNREVLGRKENHFFILYEIYSDATPVLNEESTAYEVFSKEKIRMELRETPKKFGEAFRFVLKTFYPNL